MSLRRHDVWLAALAAVLACGKVGAQEIRSGLVVTPPPRAPSSAGAARSLPLQLEVYLNGRSLQLISAFTLRADGRLASSFAELDQIGIQLPSELAAAAEIPLDHIGDLSFVYDEAAQVIRFTAGHRALKPFHISGAQTLDGPEPQRPPLGAVLNYTIYATAGATGGRAAFDGLSAALEPRVFGRFGLVESGLVKHWGSESSLVRLDTRYVHQDPASLKTLVVGDFVSGGFSWTRPVRLGGVQLRRSFGLRPDLVTQPAPSLSGSAAAPSTLELYVNSVRTLSAEAPEGPFVIDHPPIVSGAGVATLVVRDALGRESLTSRPFYASAELLAPGLTDFSLEAGYARRGFAVRSNDYDTRPAVSGSYRRGVSDTWTLQGHGEATSGMAMAGAGAVFALGNAFLVSAAGAGSTGRDGRGALVDLALEHHSPRFSVTMRSQRAFGAFEDLASWTAASAPALDHPHRVFGMPREIDQLTISAPTPWRGGSAGLTFVDARHEDDRSRVLSLSVNQDLGRVSLFASAVKDLEREGTASVFLGLSLPLGGGLSSSGGATHRRGETSAYMEASRQDHHHSGGWGWTMRAAAGETNAVDAAVRYGASFAHAEFAALHDKEQTLAHASVEGAVSLVGGRVRLSQTLDDSFALVDVGAANVPVAHDNREVGITDRRGQLLVPRLAAFSPNEISVDPTGLPLGLNAAATRATITPYSRVAAVVDLRVQDESDAALVGFVDEEGVALPLGSEVLFSDGRRAVVAYDGQAWLTRLDPLNLVSVLLPDQTRCQARIAFAPIDGQQVRREGVVCRRKDR